MRVHLRECVCVSASVCVCVCVGGGVVREIDTGRERERWRETEG